MDRHVALHTGPSHEDPGNRLSGPRNVGRAADPQLAMLQLQRAAGNQAVVASLPSRQTVQRDGDAAGPPGDAAGPPGARTELRRLNRMIDQGTERLFKVKAYNGQANSAIPAIRDVQTRFAADWGAAWDRHSSKLAEGNVAAASQNYVQGIVSGIAIGVLLAAALPAMFPAAAAASWKTATFYAFNVGSGALGSAAGAGSDLALSRPSMPAATGGRRDAEADAWQRIAEVEATARSVGNMAPDFGLQLSNAEYCKAQVQSHIDTGTGDMEWDLTREMVSTLVRWEWELRQFDTQIDGKMEAMAALGAAAQDCVVPSVDDLEKDIWRTWMSTLDDTTDEALDQDVIQKYLVRLGLIPDYFYMTDKDQHRAVAEARAYIAFKPYTGAAR